MEVIRSPEWMQQTECREGGRIWFVLDEIGLEGWATVKHIAPCPVVKPGLGRVVLSTLTHCNGDVYELRLAGSSEVLEPTGRHRLFSATRNDWVRKETLSEGEQLKTRDGVQTIASIGHRAGIHRVYNIEVETEHCYYVGPQQVLSHNQNGCAQVGNFDQARTQAFQKSGMTDPAEIVLSKMDETTGTVVEFKGQGGAKVGYDGPHDSPGPFHDQQHISWQSSGKRREGGAQRGNIPYSGPQHPSRSKVKETDD